MSQDLAQQVTDLQITVAHLEDTLERLDKVIAVQDKQMQDMQRQLQLVYGRIDNKSEEGVAPFDVMADKPPHY
jgi:SlyX protein